MRNLLLAAFGAALLGLSSSASPTSAAPAGPASVTAPDGGVTQARTMRRKKMTRRSMRRGRATQGSVGGNAEQPARRAPLTGRGGTGGAGGGGSN
jgi:hypothetical protein